jgi:hypothetical protein
MITKAEVVEWLYRLLEEAKQLSWAYTGELGQSLRASPEYVTFQSQLSLVNFQYHTPGGHCRVYKDEEASERVVVLTHEIRRTLLEIAAFG